ncbi:DinB family protein [Flavimarina sp. Hel_I_48]|uniref:DinB family protein n=1 Tax=Flavimarina sp. Hel_I_48 TaxID=1392488 RepID=UPI0004DF0305|nr:DinB family protein [Flavimarina sp. Hel_I_48]
MEDLPEYWLRGPVKNIPALLQPAAHALLQSVSEVKKYTAQFPLGLINEKPAGRASVAFHLKHLTGVLDRMLAYAQKEPLSTQQLDYLKKEQIALKNEQISPLIGAFEAKVDEALQYFQTIDPTTLTEERLVGRKHLPSTLLGLLFHAAEHSQRHVGQLLVTVSVLKNQ